MNQTNTPQAPSAPAATAAPVAAASAAPGAPPQGMPAGLNDAFVLLYKVIAILIAIVIAAMFILATVDVVLYSRDEVRQRVRLILDKNMYNKDTTDIQAMDYLQNNAENEPYNIFLEQKLISTMFFLSGAGLIILGIQIGTFFALKLWAVVKRAEFTDRIDLPMKRLSVLVVGYGAGIILSTAYKRGFIKDTQPNMQVTRSRMVKLNTFIYSNLSNDSKNRFLPALLSDDLETCIRCIKDYLRRGDPSEINLTAEDYIAAKLIFTFNLYSFFRYQIPEGDPGFEDIRTIFSSLGLKNKRIEPGMYLYYKQPVYVSNLYPNLRPQLKELIGLRERAFVKEISRNMRELNRQMSAIQDISSGKKAVRNYLLSIFLLCALFIAVLVGVFYSEAKPYLEMLAAMILRLWGVVYSVLLRMTKLIVGTK